MCPSRSLTSWPGFWRAAISSKASGRWNFQTAGLRFVKHVLYFRHLLIYPQRNVKDILHSYLLATHFDPNWYKAWHTWALANFEVVNHLLNQAEVKAADVMGTTLVPHIIPAVQGNVPLWVSCCTEQTQGSRLLPLYCLAEREFLTGYPPFADSLV